MVTAWQDTMPVGPAPENVVLTGSIFHLPHRACWWTDCVRALRGCFPGLDLLCPSFVFVCFFFVEVWKPLNLLFN